MSASTRTARVRNTLEELRLGRGRIADNTNVNVTTKMHAFVRLLVVTAHQLKQQALLDDLVPIYRWCDAFHEPRINMVRLDHGLQFFKFWFSERSDEGLSIFFRRFLLSTDVCTGLRTQRSVY